MAYRFQPPVADPLVRRVIDMLAPVVLWQRNQVRRVVIDGKETLTALHGQRALLLPNHPSETEPTVLQRVAQQVRQPVFFLATHEIFTGFEGWVIRRMGAFSVRRGWPDRTALTFAAQLLADGSHVVVFPEGETHLRGDEIIPLKHGAAQIGFWALERAPGPLPLVPIHVHYRFVGDPRPALDRGVAHLAAALGLTVTGTPAERIRACGLAVLATVEREYGFAIGSDDTIEGRIARLYGFIEDRACHTLHAELPHGDSVPVRLRALFNTAFDFRDGLAYEPTAYGQHLHRRRQLAVDAVLADLWRAQNFMAIRDELPETIERTAELLFRLEKEVYGAPRTLPLRDAHVQIGPPLDLSAHHAAYQHSRKTALATVTRELETRLNTLLSAALATETPL